MNLIQLLFVIPIFLVATSPSIAKESREEKQAKLDAACELVREKKLIPVREKFIEECVASEELPNRKECERFYADYGVKTGGRAALFYDLPECVRAFKYNQSSRTSN